jgi:hypothetical protein
MLLPLPPHVSDQREYIVGFHDPDPVTVVGKVTAAQLKTCYDLCSFCRSHPGNARQIRIRGRVPARTYRIADIPCDCPDIAPDGAPADDRFDKFRI